MESVEEVQSQVIERPTGLRLERWGRRWSQAATIAIAVNLCLVFFNLTYVPLRHVYQVYLPGLVKLYDPLKGIEPHPVTQDYLQDISTLRTTLESEGLNDPATQTLLADLRQQSTTLIDENPYLASGQITTFARLKRRIQDFTDINSADRAFQQFWQADYWQDIGWPTAEQFIDMQLVPLLQRNYFRQTLPTGQFVDEFWRIDVIFVIFFAVELLIRTLIISRRDPDISWGVALARRWYELPLLLPFWRWLRLLPLAVRCHRTHLLNVENLIGQVTHEPAAYLADRVSKFAMVRLINQTQTTVRSGALLNPRQPDAAYTRIGDPAKLDQITDRLVQVIVLRVMPTVKPDLEQLLRHSLRQALLGGDVYTGLRQLPGFDSLPGDAVDGVADYLAQASVDVLAHSYTDDEGRVLLDQLSREFRQALGQELQTHANSEELQALLSDLLEELKVNYIQRSEQDDPRTTLREVDVLDQQTQSHQSR
ncbi:hypothetical protein [Leptolyngbya iicbica]|uniref:Uncharacterized protein n=2 Tax=Cyanophyceae TaxID=3028117 RepID=A0A4Q7E8Z5_9CYAN|nr:hypothetical protein [Leptolyngbya sp. LK]RZM78874.1 hypothetical protein DYY88_08790 [Leptolyngbya sp. LK]